METNEKTGAVRLCGQCPDWKEEKTMCKGMGFCGNAKARDTKVGLDKVSLTCRLLSSEDKCAIAH